MNVVDRILGTTWSRRRFIRLIGVSAGAAVAAGLLAACGDDDDDDDGPTTGGDATATPAGATPAAATATTGAAAATGGEITVAAPQDRYRTEPNRANIGMSIPNTNIFEQLVSLTPDFEAGPLLAESWEFIEPNTWRFNLRTEVTFHDGTAFTAEAVKWSMARVAATGGGVFHVGEDSVKIVDDQTVEITPTQPNRRMVLQLSSVNTASIVAPNTEPLDKRVGTGPFKEVEYLKEDRYVVEAFDNYWGDKAKLDRITFRFMPDPTTRLLALQAREVDVAYDIPREATAEVTATEGLRIVTSKVGAYEALYFNIHGDEPFDLGQDVAVRRAVAYAIDKDAIVNDVWQGNAEISNTMIPAGALGEAAKTIQGTPYDPDMARQILDEAGWVEGSDDIREKDGRRLQLTMVVGYPSAEIHTPMPEFVQAQLKDVGIEMEIVQTPDVGNYETRLQSGEGDLWAEVGNQSDSDPCYLPGLLFYSPQPEGDPESAMYANVFAPGKQFDTHIDQCAAASTVEEVQQAAANAMKVLIDEEFVVIPLAGIFRIYGVADRVEGFEAHPVQFVQSWAGVSVKTG